MKTQVHNNENVNYSVSIFNVIVCVLSLIFGTCSFVQEMKQAKIEFENDFYSTYGLKQYVKEYNKNSFAFLYFLTLFFGVYSIYLGFSNYTYVGGKFAIMSGTFATIISTLGIAAYSFS